jgi:predicted nucleic acid-binding Zn ribbon protein
MNEEEMARAVQKGIEKAEEEKKRKEALKKVIFVIIAFMVLAVLPKIFG